MTLYGPHLSYLMPLLDLLTTDPSHREQLIRAHAAALSSRQAPGAGDTPIAWITIQLARMLSTYLTATSTDRNRLLTKCGCVLSQDLDWLALLMLPNRQQRESAIAVITQVSPILSLVFSPTWGAQPGNNRRPTGTNG